MRWFNNLNVGTRLLFAFLLMALITAAVGVFGLVNMARINEITDIMYERELVGLSELKEVNIIVLYLDRNLRNMILANTEEDRNRNIENNRSYQLILEETLASAAEKFVTAEGKKKIKEIQEILPTFLDMNRRIIEAVSREALQEARESVELVQGKGRELSDALDIHLTEANELKENLAAEFSQEATHLYQQATRLMIIVIGISVIVGIFLGILITLGLTGQLGGEPAYISKIVKQVSEGDLTVEFVNKGKKKERGVYLAVKEMTEKLREVVAEVSSATENVATGSEEISTASQKLSQGATEQASSAEELSSSMEEMSSTITQNNDNAQQTEKIAFKAAEDAKEGEKAVNEAVSAMKEIASKISIIEEIARQTNLLALNAAIESARAGEQGRGFAVVASEVRKLAERSGKSAAEISELSKHSVKIAEKAEELFGRILPDIEHTAQLVQEISAASNEQNTGAKQINAAIMQLDTVIQQNASAAEELAGTSEELASQAEQLKDTISFFKLDIKTRKTLLKALPVSVVRTGSSKSSETKSPKKIQGAEKNISTGITLSNSGDENFEEF